MERTRVIVYAKNLEELTEDLKWLFDGLLPPEAIESYRNISDLASRLSVIRHESIILLLMPTENQELRDIQAIRHLLDNLRIILLLPDSSADTIMAGHSLHPRFISFLNNSLTDVKAVLQKMSDRNTNIG